MLISEYLLRSPEHVSCNTFLSRSLRHQKGEKETAGQQPEWGVTVQKANV